MALLPADIILGKLALGRSYVTRADAVRIAEAIDHSLRTGRRESFSQAAVRLGYLEPRRVDELLSVVRDGVLVCRGSCGERYRLATLQPEQTISCGRCGGRLFVARDGLPARPVAAAAPTPSPAPPPAGAAGQGRRPSGQTFLELEVVDLGSDEAVVPEAELRRKMSLQETADPDHDEPPPDDLGGNTYIDLELEMPDDRGPPGERRSDPPAEQVPAAGGEEAEGTMELGLDGETTMTCDGPRELFEPFAIGALQVLAPVGRGGMGMVYRARDARGQVVALKVMHQGAELGEEVLARFRREVQLTSALQHPGIVRVHEAGVVEDGPMQGRPFFTMDYVPGRDLVAWAQEARRTPVECARLVQQVCQAMDYAHGRGVIHRDLKPSNVLVRRPDERPLVCDFGLARYKADMQHLTRTGDILGTPSYMPPEQALGDRKRIGPPTDVYALGAILYFLLTGRPPFRGPSAFATIDKVVRQPPEPPRALNPAVTPALEQVVLKALAKEPQARYPTCGALERALAPLT